MQFDIRKIAGKKSASCEDADPLLEALRYVSRCFGIYISKAVAVRGLPLQSDRLPMRLLSRAADNCGLIALPGQRPLDDISSPILPAIVISKKSEVFVLVELSRETGQVGYVVADKSRNVVHETLVEFSKNYSGYAVFFKPMSDANGESIRSLTNGSHWFWGTLAGYWRDYLHIALAAFLINMLALVSPLFTMNVYDRVVPNFAIPTLWALAIGVILSMIFDFSLRVARGQIINSAGKRADNALARKIFAHAIAIDLEMRPPSSGQFANHVKEFETVREFITSSSLVSLIDLCFIFIFVAVLFIVVGSLALVPLIAVPIVLVLNLFVQAPLSKAVQKTQMESALRHSIIVESIANIDTIRALNAEGGVQTKWERSVAASSSAILRGRFWALLAQSGTTFVQASVSVATIIWGVYLISENQVSMGGLIAAMMMSSRCLAPLASVAGTMTRLRQTINAYRVLDGLMNAPTERRPGRNYINREMSSGSIEFKHVSFRYPQSTADCLSSVSFSIKSGETIGLIGRVGAGKSTIGRLLAGLYYPTDGTILVDGTDTRQFDPTDLRTGVGFLSQDNVLFAGSIRDNLIASNPNATEEEISEAAHISGVDEFVSKHPLGYDRPVGEGGRLLSGGQKQSVALARMLLRKPKVLFLDEPSSNLDLASERKLIARLRDFTASQATIIISTHRMSLVELTDRLLTIEEGHLVLDGPRDKVLRELQQMGAANASPVSKMGVA